MAVGDSNSASNWQIRCLATPLSFLAVGWISIWRQRSAHETPWTGHPRPVRAADDDGRPPHRSIALCWKCAGTVGRSCVPSCVFTPAPHPEPPWWRPHVPRCHQWRTSPSELKIPWGKPRQGSKPCPGKPFQVLSHLGLPPTPARLLPTAPPPPPSSRRISATGRESVPTNEEKRSVRIEPSSRGPTVCNRSRPSAGGAPPQGPPPNNLSRQRARKGRKADDHVGQKAVSSRFVSRRGVVDSSSTACPRNGG